MRACFFHSLFLFSSRIYLLATPLLSPCYLLAISLLPPYYPLATILLPSCYLLPTFFLLSCYLLPSGFLEHTLNVASSYLPRTFPVPCHYFVFTKRINPLQIVLYCFRIVNYEFWISFFQLSFSCRCLKPERNPKASRRNLTTSISRRWRRLRSVTVGRNDLRDRTPSTASTLKECPISCNGRPLSGSVIFVSFQSADPTDAAVTERWRFQRHSEVAYDLWFAFAIE